MRMFIGGSVALAAMALSAFPVSAQAQRRAAPATTPTVFGCDSPAGHMCYFAVSAPNGAVIARFSVPAQGRVQAIFPQTPGQTYVVTVDQDHSDDPTCQAATRVNLFCKRAYVVAGYNN